MYLKIIPYQFVKVHYASVVDWRWNSNIIRANPDFHERPRYDFALVQIDGNECIFIQILFLFSMAYNGTKHNLAVVLPMDAPRMQENRARDDALRLTRVSPRRRMHSVVIDTSTIIRGALLTPDISSNAGEFLVVNTVDEDMWRRLESVVLKLNARF